MPTLQGNNNSPLVLTPTDRESFWLAAGENVTFVATGQDTDGEFSLFDFFLPPQVGPAPHTHSNEDEGFYVLEGNLSLQMHDQTFTATPGTFVYLPRNHIHGFRNLSSTPVRFIDIALPSGIDNLFRNLGVPGTITSPPPPPPLDSAFLDQVMAISSQYGLELTDSLLLFSAPQYSINDAVAPVIVARTGSNEEPVSVTVTAQYSVDNSTIQIPVSLAAGERVTTVPIPINSNGLISPTINAALTDIPNFLTPAPLHDQAVLNIVGNDALPSMNPIGSENSSTMTDAEGSHHHVPMFLNSSQQSFGLGGETFNVIATGADTEGQISLFDVLVPPQTGAESFIYGNNAEAYYILDGDVSFLLPDQTITASPGSFVYFPEGNQYAISNQGTNPGRTLLISPGGLFNATSIPEPSFTLGLLVILAWGIISQMKNKLQKTEITALSKCKSITHL
jgi:mannose-6-phosphate isomerase-like protein (cupin superfamily)